MTQQTKLPAGIPQELEWWLVKWATFTDAEVESLYENKKAQIVSYVAECKAQDKAPGNYGDALKQMFILLNAEMKRRELL